MQTREPLLWTIPEAAEQLGIGRSKLYELLRLGTIPTVRIGKSVRVPSRAIRDYAERLEAEQAVVA